MVELSSVKEQIAQLKDHVKIFEGTLEELQQEMAKFERGVQTDKNQIAQVFYFYYFLNTHVYKKEISFVNIIICIAAREKTAAVCERRGEHNKQSLGSKGSSGNFEATAARESSEDWQQKQGDE